MRHKVVAHEVIFRQVTIVSYSPVIQIKLYEGGLVGLTWSKQKWLFWRAGFFFGQSEPSKKLCY